LQSRFQWRGMTNPVLSNLERGFQGTGKTAVMVTQ
jgi:hypothetical protein